jgi:predicted HNH restriction endonuclease
VDPIQDLRPVCPNCHAVIHRGDPIHSIEAVRAMLDCARAGRAARAD